MKLPRDPRALSNARLQSDFELVAQLLGRMVKRFPQDGQLVASTNIDLVAEIAASQRLAPVVSLESGTVMVLVTYQPSAAAASRVRKQATGTTMKSRCRTCSVCSFALARC